MAPNTPVRLYDFNDELITVPFITLMTWARGLKAFGEGHIADTVRQYLSAPADYPLDELVYHINTSYDDIKAQIQGE